MLSYSLIITIISKLRHSVEKDGENKKKQRTCVVHIPNQGAKPSRQPAYGVKYRPVAACGFCIQYPGILALVRNMKHVVTFIYQFKLPEGLMPAIGWRVCWTIS
jgi:hypothetical protein